MFTIVGILANSFGLLFFLKKQRKDITTTLFIALTAVDLATAVSLGPFQLLINTQAINFYNFTTQQFTLFGIISAISNIEVSNFSNISNVSNAPSPVINTSQFNFKLYCIFTVTLESNLSPRQFILGGAISAKFMFFRVVSTKSWNEEGLKRFPEGAKYFKGRHLKERAKICTFNSSEKYGAPY